MFSHRRLIEMAASFFLITQVTLRLTDGQHRCFGIRQALKDIQAEQAEYLPILSQLEIGVLLYAGLSLEENVKPSAIKTF
jgi:DNA sulfur modification protein DndB